MSIILKPVVTEKMTAISEDLPQYAFIVAKDANKIQIKNAVEELYDVRVESVNTMNYLGKKQTRYNKTGFITGRKKSFKKAIVTLEDGETIDFFSNI